MKDVLHTPDHDQTDRHYDDKGHMPLTQTLNQDMPHVHPGQIQDLGGPVGEIRNSLHQQMRQQETPTPQQRARAQADRLSAQAAVVMDEEEVDIETAAQEDRNNRIYRWVGDSGQPIVREIDKEGIDDVAIPGSRTGNPLEIPAEAKLGDKVWDIKEDGSSELMVQNKDHSWAYPINRKFTQDNVIKKLKVHLSFPPINPRVSQRRVTVEVARNGLPAEFFFPPDVPNLEILVPFNQLIHVEVTHTNQEGRDGRPYVVDFYSNPAVTPRPLEASPLTFNLEEQVNVPGQQVFGAANKSDDEAIAKGPPIVQSKESVEQLDPNMESDPRLEDKRQARLVKDAEKLYGTKINVEEGNVQKPVSKLSKAESKRIKQLSQPEQPPVETDTPPVSTKVESEKEKIPESEKQPKEDEFKIKK